MKRLKYLLIFLFVIFLSLFLGPHIIRFLVTLFNVMLEFRFVVDNYHVYRIFLWTESYAEPQIFYLDDLEGFKNSSFNPEVPIKVMFHGFSDEPTTAWVSLLRDSYLYKTPGKYNIISIDWQSSAESPWYNRASKNAKHAGNQTARWFKSVVDMYGLNWDNVHVIGASLGAHAAGYFGRFTDGKCGRVTGLDPSGPLFHDGPADRLDPSDGQFVDVIHTAGRWVGNDDIQGHVDFFPNGGRASQPDCVETAALYCSHFMVE